VHLKGSTNDRSVCAEADIHIRNLTQEVISLNQECTFSTYENICPKRAMQDKVGYYKSNLNNSIKMSKIP
jgi:hypothetical protein